MFGALVWLTAMGVVFSCGGKTTGSSGNSATCATTTAPCGGSIAGTWNIVGACSTGGATMPDATCAGESITVISVSDTGSFTFDADGTYRASLSASAAEDLSVPASCLSAGGGSVSCDQLGMALSSPLVQSDGGTVGSVSGSCSTAGSACSCNLSLSVPNAMASGTYVVSGTSVTLTPSGGNATSDGFCVQGNTLYLLSGAASAMTAPMPAAQLTATRQ
jgi:hypothetical protein